MGNGEEWFEYHLTPDGWKKGTERWEFQPEYRAPPANRFLTLRRTEYFGSQGATPVHIDEEWVHLDTDAVAALINKYGSKPLDWS